MTFKWKDYRARGAAPGKAWIKPMTLDAAEFIRRFLLHVLPSGFHRIRHDGFLAGPGRAATIDRVRDLIAAASEQSFRRSDAPHSDPAADRPEATASICPYCGGRMRVLETFARGAKPRSFKAEPAGIDSS